MLADLTSAFTPRASYDIAIVGAGAAGITLAMTLMKAGRSVFLAEAGGLELSGQSQAVYKGRIAGDPFHQLDTARLRYFGGTTGHWGGDCRPLDPQDFEAKTGNPDTEWPIRAADLEPYADRARTILGLSPFRPDVALPNTARLKDAQWIYSDPMRFGVVYRAPIAAAANIDALTNCNLIGLQIDDDAVKTLKFRNWGETGLEVRAQHVVLACGGIENSRILLIANAKYANAVGNQGNAVGRYWMAHHIIPGGDLVVLKPDRFGHDPRFNAAVWVPSRGVLAENKTLNAAVKIYVDEVPNERVLSDFISMAPQFAPDKRGVTGNSIHGTGSLQVWAEQEPLASNHVGLDAGEFDFFGLPRARLDVRKSPLDRRSARTAALEVAGYVAREDSGRVKIAPWLLSDTMPWPANAVRHAFHLMGGTRMARGSGKGVVDGDCRVFGVKNLYVAGSSVFTSCGHANPTYTIVQLALRLADHIDTSLGTRPTRGASARALAANDQVPVPLDA